MHCYVCYWYVLVSIDLKSVLTYTFIILGGCHPDTIYVSKDARILGYSSKPKRVREQKSLGNTDLDTGMHKGRGSRGGGAVVSPSPPSTQSYVSLIVP